MVTGIVGLGGCPLVSVGLKPDDCELAPDEIISENEGTEIAASLFGPSLASFASTGSNLSPI